MQPPFCDGLRDSVTVVEAIGRRELGSAVDAMVEAFWTYPETLHLLPDEHRRRRVLPRYLRSDAIDALRFQMLFGAKRDGRVVGAAAWIPPEAYPVSLRRQVRQLVGLAPTLPWAWRSAREAQRGQAANRDVHRRHPPHFYLRAIGVQPDAHGHGFGSELVRAVIARADAASVGCFLQTATPENVTWYRRFGFEIAEKYRPTPSWPQVWAMWRDPSR